MQRKETLDQRDCKCKDPGAGEITASGSYGWFVGLQERLHVVGGAGEELGG